MFSVTLSFYKFHSKEKFSFFIVKYSLVQNKQNIQSKKCLINVLLGRDVLERRIFIIKNINLCLCHLMMFQVFIHLAKRS